MPLVPDRKDWTWVLSQRCPECGFSAAEVTPATLPASIFGMLPRWREALRRPGVAQRPSDATWSVLEYACHVRDVFILFDYRLVRMLSDDDARFEDWDQDRAAIEQDYLHADPAEVSTALTAAGERIAASFAGVPAEQWGRSGTRSNGSVFTILTFSQYLMHEAVHHLHDVDG